LFLMVWSKRHPLIISVGSWASLMGCIALMCALSGLEAGPDQEFDICAKLSWIMLAFLWIVALPRFALMLHYGIPFVIPTEAEMYHKSEVPKALREIRGCSMFVFLYFAGAGWFTYCYYSGAMLTCAIMKFSLGFYGLYCMWYMYNELKESYERKVDVNKRALYFIAAILGLSMVTMGVGGYYFVNDVYKTTLPKVGNGSSIEMNKPCAMWIFDNHDLWHFFSAIGLGCQIWVSMLLDGVQDMTNRKDLAVF